MTDERNGLRWTPRPLVLLACLIVAPIMILWVGVVQVRSAQFENRDQPRERTVLTMEVQDGDAAASRPEPTINQRTQFQTVVETQYRDEHRTRHVPELDPKTGQYRIKEIHEVVKRPVTTSRMIARPAKSPSHEPAVLQLVQQLRGMDRDDTAREAKLDELRQRLNLEFARMHEQQAQQIEQTESRLKSLKKLHDLRGDNRDKIVQRRIDELMGKDEALEWDPQSRDTVSNTRLTSPVTVGATRANAFPSVAGTLPSTARRSRSIPPGMPHPVMNPPGVPQPAVAPTAVPQPAVPQPAVPPEPAVPQPASALGISRSLPPQPANPGGINQPPQLRPSTTQSRQITSQSRQRPTTTESQVNQSRGRVRISGPADSMGPSSLGSSMPKPASNAQPGGFPTDVPRISTRVEASTAVLGKLFELARSAATADVEMGSAKAELDSLRRMSGRDSSVAQQSLNRARLKVEKLKRQIDLNRIELEALSAVFYRDSELAEAALKNAVEKQEIIARRAEKGTVANRELSQANFELIQAEKALEGAKENLRQLKLALNVLDNDSDEQSENDGYADSEKGLEETTDEGAAEDNTTDGKDGVDDEAEEIEVEGGEEVEIEEAKDLDVDTDDLDEADLDDVDNEGDLDDADTSDATRR